MHGVPPLSGHFTAGCGHLQHVNLRASPPQVVAQDVVFPENVDVSLQDIGGLEPVEDILVNLRMLRCARESMSSAGTWAVEIFLLKYVLTQCHWVFYRKPRCSCRCSDQICSRATYCG